MNRMEVSGMSSEGSESHREDFVSAVRTSIRVQRWPYLLSRI